MSASLSPRPVRFVTAKLFEQLTGYTEKAVEHKRAEGVWREGREYGGYDAALKLAGRIEAGCLAHARRKFDELVKANASQVAVQAIVRLAALYRIEADARELSCEQRLQMRQERSKPLWQELHAWLQLELGAAGEPLARHHQ